MNKQFVPRVSFFLQQSMHGADTNSKVGIRIMRVIMHIMDGYFHPNCCILHIEILQDIITHNLSDKIFSFGFV